MATPYVLFHQNCTDGFCAAWLFKQAFPNAECLPVQYGQDPPALEPGRPVYIVDFSYDRETLLQMMEAALPERLLVLDHHKTAQEALQGLDFCFFDMERSGARLAFDFLVDTNWWPGDYLPVGGIETLVDYVEDRDLWQWQLPDSQAVSAALRSYPFDFDVWTDFITNRHFDELITEGHAIQRYRQQLIDAHVKRAREVTLAGYQVQGVACTAGEIISEVAGTLAQTAPFGVCWFDMADGYRVFSLRSRGEEAVDVSAIAKACGGGGHRNAAGFRMPI